MTIVGCWPLATSTLGLRNRRSIRPDTLADGARAERLLREMPDPGVLLADEQTHEIRATDISLEDLYGVAPLPAGALMVGTRGAVYVLDNGEIQPYAASASPIRGAVMRRTRSITGCSSSMPSRKERR